MTVADIWKIMGSLFHNNSGNESWFSSYITSIITRERRISVIYFAIVSFLIVFGNILTLSVVSKKKRKKPTDILLGVLATLDLVTPLLTFPLLVIYGITETWVGGKATCFMSAFITMFLFKFSMLTAAMIAIDRFLAIAKPFFYRSKILLRPTRFSIGVFGLYSLVTALIPLTGMISQSGRASDWSLCFYHWAAVSRAKTITRIYVIVGMIDTALTVSLVMICNIGVVVYFTKRRHQRRKNVGPAASDIGRQSSFSTRPSRNSIQRRSDKKYAKLMALVSIYFPLCFAPIQVLISLQHFGKTSLTPETIVYYQLHIVAISLLLNPLLHALIRKHYRRAYWFILCHPTVLREPTNNEFDFDADNREGPEFERRNLNIRELSVAALATARFRSNVRRAKERRSDGASTTENITVIPIIVKRDFSLENETTEHHAPIPSNNLGSDGDLGRISSSTECSESTPMNLRPRLELLRSLSWTSSYFSDYEPESLPPSPSCLTVSGPSFGTRQRATSDGSEMDRLTVCSDLPLASGRSSFDSTVFDSRRADKVNSWLLKEPVETMSLTTSPIDVKDDRSQLQSCCKPHHLPPLSSTSATDRDTSNVVHTRTPTRTFNLLQNALKIAKVEPSKH